MPRGDIYNAAWGRFRLPHSKRLRPGCVKYFIYEEVRSEL